MFLAVALGPGKKQLNGVISDELSDIIEERARALAWTKSHFATRIVEWWQLQGCPPVHPADAGLKKGFRSNPKPAPASQ